MSTKQKDFSRNSLFNTANSTKDFGFRKEVSRELGQLQRVTYKLTHYKIFKRKNNFSL